VTESVSHHLGLVAGRPIPIRKLLTIFRADDVRQLNTAMKSAVTIGRSFDLELRVAEGAEGWIRCIGKAEQVDGRTIRLHGTVQNVTERKLAERTLRETRDFFLAGLDAMPSLVMHVSAERRVSYCNRSPLRMMLACGEPSGESLQQVLGPDLYAELEPNVSAALANEARSDLRVLRRERESRDVQLNFIPERRLGQGRNGCFIVLTDVTELKQLEERLRHAEKMQVVGQLTGGVAHDFNNLLGVIIGNLQLMERDVGKNPALSKKLTTAMRAALRGGDLTRRLLTFARRQIFDPTVVDLKHQLGNFAELMQRTLGESVETHLVLPADLWHVRVDSVQLESAILNLAINARDAMPQGGKLTVVARNLRVDGDAELDLAPGDYAVIQVIDTGSGIAPELLPRVFDPFFTTKESGKGSGLGLSIVQGFARQAGGTAAISSELGRGTTVSIFLPACIDQQSTHEDTIVLKQMPGGDETILLVEDDSDLCATASQALQRLGYQVLACANGEEALRVLERNRGIDLLFTDIMMPGGVLGTLLAQRARQINPRIRVLFTTGYIDDAAADAVSAVEEVLPKPYRNEDLALKVRNLLDQEAHVG
jgi:signal transduction histidine kinase/CheY-like chemotaxis protein